MADKKKFTADTDTHLGSLPEDGKNEFIQNSEPEDINPSRFRPENEKESDQVEDDFMSFNTDSMDDLAKLKEDFNQSDTKE